MLSRTEISRQHGFGTPLRNCDPPRVHGYRGLESAKMQALLRGSTFSRT